MKIQKIKLSGFKSFLDETTIDFTTLQGIWWVSGHIGAGKTTIGEAIIYGLYGTVSGKNNTALISWGKKHGLVELWCQSRGKNLYIRRELNSYGQSPMSVEADGEPIVFTNKRSAQAQLETEYLDTSRTTMELLCIISFNNFKSLSTLNTKDTKLFLDQVLGFDSLTAYIDACKEEQSQLRTELTGVQANIRAINSQIDRMRSYTFVDGDIDATKASIAELKQNIANKESERDVVLAPLHSELTTNNTKLVEVRTLGVNKKREIDFIKKGTCPTCGAPIDQSQLSIKEQERAVLAEQYMTISARISDLSAQISQISSEATNYITEIKSRVKSQENELVRLVEQTKHTAVNEEEIVKLQAEVAGYEERANQISTELTEYERLVQIMQVQIRSQVLESFIPSLNSKIKELAGMLSLRYIPEYDSMFKCSIRSASLDAIPTSSLSTGQLKMVDMVIILAIIGSLISKVSSNVIFLDELFSNLDPRTRSELVSVLRATLPQGSSVLIVSHQDMDGGLFDGHIKMKLVQDTSGTDKTQISFE
jgi:DNA repair exonuclease SbcCD ATPase subunit